MRVEKEVYRMTDMRRNRFICLFICISLCFSMLLLIPSLATDVYAAACYIDDYGNEDDDHGYFTFVTKGYKEGDSLLASFELSKDYLPSDSFSYSKGIEYYSYSGGSISSYIPCSTSLVTDSEHVDAVSTRPLRMRSTMAFCNTSV